MNPRAHNGSRPRQPQLNGWLLLLWTVTGLLAGAETARAQGLRSSELEAAFLLNFLRFTAWPDAAFGSAEDPVVVTLIGADAIALDLSLLASGERLGAEQRKIVVETRDGIDPRARGRGRSARPATPDDLRSSHMIFVGRREALHCEWILDQVEESPVLTVSDETGFARGGGMLALVVRGGRMTFDANTTEINRSGLTVSSKVLRLARLVETEDP